MMAVHSLMLIVRTRPVKANLVGKRRKIRRSKRLYARAGAEHEEK